MAQKLLPLDRIPTREEAMSAPLHNVWEGFSGWHCQTAILHWGDSVADTHPTKALAIMLREVLMERSGKEQEIFLNDDNTVMITPRHPVFGREELADYTAACHFMLWEIAYRNRENPASPGKGTNP
jgi:hypothetical protein